MMMMTSLDVCKESTSRRQYDLVVSSDRAESTGHEVCGDDNDNELRPLQQVNKSQQQIVEVKHSEFLLNGLQYLKTNSVLCDLTLVAQNRRFECHKIILACVSDYFRSMFTSGMKESTQSEIELKGVNASGLEKVIEIVYTSRTTFSTYYDLFEIVATANHLQCFLVIEFCERNLVEQLDMLNFNYFLQMATLYNMKRLCERVESFLIDNLAGLVYQSSNESTTGQMDSFLRSINYEQLVKCLSSDLLRVKEIDLFYLVWRWIYLNLFAKKKHKLQLNRFDLSKKFKPAAGCRTDEETTMSLCQYKKIDIIRSLLKHIRFTLIKPHDLVNRVQSVNKIMLSDRCLRKMIVNALNYHLLPNLHSSGLLKSERIRSSRQTVFLVGGREINPTPTLHDECYSLNDLLERESSSTNMINKVSITQMPNSQSHMQCVATPDNFLYALGGCLSQCVHGESATNACLRFDPRLNTWSFVSSMEDKRAYFYAAHVTTSYGQEFIYAMGGKNKEGALNKVERYHIASNSWTQQQPMPMSLYAHGGCVVNNSNIYISGGYANGLFVSNLYSYNILLDQWDSLAPMLAPRGWHCMTLVNDLIYVFGGCFLSSQGHNQPTTNLPPPISFMYPSEVTQPVQVTECYSPRTNQWTMLKSMTNLHKEASYLTHKSHVYIIGGYNIHTKTGQKLVSRYDCEKDSWSTVGQLPSGMTGMSICLLDIPWFLLENEPMNTDLFDRHGRLDDLDDQDVMSSLTTDSSNETSSSEDDDELFYYDTESDDSVNKKKEAR